ncbi:hypothetical protein PVK06_041478 [Gossypium arboreum]|uniref:Retrovirus-related Pol polyprotein from transposon TNT 1-94 n=1 Tax=Gossypium arboreum TaxID=29729 RepID=A0ABR0N8B9_GOSAR|nr:hypothetical protein PVK06_041478 [Gossypium arboreum]
MMSYMQRQYLLEIVNGSEVTQSKAEGVVKVENKSKKAMFLLKSTVEEDVLEHIRDATTPKKAWDTLTMQFLSKNVSNRVFRHESPQWQTLEIKFWSSN